MTISICAILAVAIYLSSVIATASETSNNEKRCCEYGEGVITQPVLGQNIQPGEVFAFSYTPRNGQSYTSLNFTVALLTSPPDTDSENYFTEMLAGSGAATGYYFGHFGIASVGNPSPRNPPPTTLTMPDFTKSPWFSSPVYNVPMNLVVLEEWVEEAKIGRHLSMASNYFTYNYTASHPELLCNPPVSKSTGRCGCEFTDYCGTGFTGIDFQYDPNARILSQTSFPNRQGCRDACDNTRDCYSYIYHEASQSCNLVSPWFTQFVSEPGWDLGVYKDRNCKEVCQANAILG